MYFVKCYHTLFKLPTHHAIVLLAIMRHDLSKYSPTIKEIAEDAGVSERTVTNVIKELKEKKTGPRLKITKKKTSNRKLVNRYQVLGLEDTEKTVDEERFPDDEPLMYVPGMFQPAVESSDEEYEEFLRDQYPDL